MASDGQKLITLFGGGGFVGRYAAQRLLKAGWRVRIAERDPRKAWFLKPLGGLGQTQFVAADVTNPRTVAAAVQGSDAVVNFVGVLKGAFFPIHSDGAANIARAAAEAGAAALVHISAIGADDQAESNYARSKGEGEARVRAAFPGATILRPSIVFGREDQFVNRFARMARMMPAVPVMRAAAKFQPVYVGDVARAVASAAAEPDVHGGRTFELGGPQRMSMRELNEWIGRETGRVRPLINVPDAIGAVMARIGALVPGAPITWDQWLMLQSDNVVAPDAEGLDAFGVSPTPLAAVGESMLASYRRQGRFATVRSPY